MYTALLLHRTNEINPNLIIPLSLIFWAFVLVKITQLILHYKAKRRLIDQGLVDQEASDFLNKKNQHDSHTSLKWGLLGICLGTALIVIQFLPFSIQSSFSYGLVAMAVGAAYLLYYIAVLAQQKNK
ncbi:MAG TPA: hypothetical protein DCS93_36935 [Microscillaceae bacterium]|nr:hypothetical protein [Microscillaceae bacterium]